MLTERVIALASLPESTEQFNSLVHKVEDCTISKIFGDAEILGDIFSYIAGVIGLPGNINEEGAGLLLRGALFHFKDSPESFLAALASIQALEADDEDFVEIPVFSEFYAYNQPKAILEIWASFSIKMQPHPNAPLHEKRSMDSYVSALPEFDLPKIYDFVDSVDRGCGFRDNRLLGPLAKHLYSTDNVKYLSILESKHNVFEIRALIGGLSEIQKLSISATTANKLAMVECIRQVIYFRHNNAPIPQEYIELIAESIVSIANTNSGIFEKILKYFLKYPVRCPDFLSALGVATATLGEQHIERLIQSIPIHFELENDISIYRRFLESMAGNTSNSSFAAILSGLFKRRQEFLKTSERPTANKPRYTNLADFQVNHLVNIPHETYCQCLADLSSQLSNIRLQWYRSSTKYENNLWGIISEMELASLAFCSRQKKHPTSEQENVSGLIDHYLNKSIAFDLMQFSTYEQVSTVINRIRQNFSLPLMDR